MSWRALKQIVRVGIPSEPAPAIDPASQCPGDDDAGGGKRSESRRSWPSFGRAVAIRAVDAGSCNGCELEMHALTNPYYNIEGLGIKFVASPRHADLLLVTGPVAAHMEAALRRTYRGRAGTQARGRDRRVRVQRWRVRGKLCQSRPRGQRHSGGCRGGRLPTAAGGNPARHPARVAALADARASA
jgi:hypothetical protein